MANGQLLFLALKVVSYMCVKILSGDIAMTFVSYDIL